MAALSAMGVDVYTKRTRTVPAFMMPFTNPKHDVDVSGQMHVNGHIEIGLTQVSMLLGHCCCRRGPLSDKVSVCKEKTSHSHTLCLSSTLGVQAHAEDCTLQFRKMYLCHLQVWYSILKGQCVPAVAQSTAPLLPQHGLVLDVGSNFGYYALYAAAHGCRCGHCLFRTRRLGIESVM